MHLPALRPGGAATRPKDCPCICLRVTISQLSVILKGTTMPYTSPLTGTDADKLICRLLRERAKREMGRTRMEPIKAGVQNAPPEVLPPQPRAGDTHKLDGRCAVEELRGWVPLGENMACAVYKRVWRGEHYVRWRVWHRHRTYGEWYPDARRYGVFPSEAIGELCEGLLRAG